MRKIKVLQFLINNGKGGKTVAILENWRLLNKEKFQMDFITIKNKILIEDEIAKQGSKIHYISCYAEENKDKFSEEVESVLKEGYDIIHLHTSFWKSTLVEEIAKKIGVKKIIIHSHNTGVSMIEDSNMMEQMKSQHMLVRDSLDENVATDFWACSSAAADWLFGNRIPRERIKIVRDAIDVGRFSFNANTRDLCRKRWGIEDKFVLGHVGRFSYQKNQEFLIDVLKILKDEMPNVMLLLVGEGKTKQSVIDRVEELHLQDEIVFLGNQDRVEEVYQVLDLFVFPSRFEGFGCVLLEAQCAGLECITSDNIPKDVMVTSHIAFLPLQADLWALEIIKRKNYVRRDRADEVTKAGFDIKYNIKELERLYEEGL